MLNKTSPIYAYYLETCETLTQLIIFRNLQPMRNSATVYLKYEERMTHIFSQDFQVWSCVKRYAPLTFSSTWVEFY